MTDRKIWKAVLCFAMSIVLAVPGCAANTPASESAQSDLQEAAQGGTGYSHYRWMSPTCGTALRERSPRVRRFSAGLADFLIRFIAAALRLEAA